MIPIAERREASGRDQAILHHQCLGERIAGDISSRARLTTGQASAVSARRSDDRAVVRSALPGTGHISEARAWSRRLRTAHNVTAGQVATALRGRKGLVRRRSGVHAWLQRDRNDSVVSTAKAARPAGRQG